MQSVKDILPGIFTKLQSPQFQEKSLIYQEWSSIAGPKLAEHTRPSLGKNKELYVWVDQSSLAFELNQRYAQSFLKRAQAVVGEDKITSIRFRVGQLR